ncbi:alpha/beta hydrolase [Chloroflexus sp.]|uniref:alpha/beta hydrolase n=1 Tax=Chloroflexus sp. TaxID=1904827 RepID=UPI00262B6C53|nr:alpha/beta fold hydrolase [uncultured Chloroflexus sp.]
MKTRRAILLLATATRSLPFASIKHAVLTIVVGYCALCIGLYLVQERLIFHSEVDPVGAQYNFGWPVSEVFIPVADARLHTLWFRVPDPKGVVIYFRGNGSSLRVWSARAIPLLKRGYDVVMADYRSYGQSAGSISSEEQLFADADAIYTWVRERYPEEQIVLYGNSLGSGFASRLAATYQPRLLILESPLYSLEEIARRQLPWVPGFLLKYPIRSHSWIGQVRCPVVIFHGTDDQIVSFDQSERLAALVTAPLAFYRIEGGGHADFKQYPLYHAALDTALTSVTDMPATAGR